VRGNRLCSEALDETTPGERQASSYYRHTRSLTALACIGRLPQLTLPLADSAGVPVGLFFIAEDKNLFLAEATRALGLTSLVED
jgi:hypothetical protein